MKRRALQIMFLLLLGAIVNVAVAWGCAIIQYESRPLIGTCTNLIVIAHSGWNAHLVKRKGFVAVDWMELVRGPIDADIEASMRQFRQTLNQSQMPSGCDIRREYAWASLPLDTPLSPTEEVEFIFMPRGTDCGFGWPALSFRYQLQKNSDKATTELTRGWVIQKSRGAALGPLAIPYCAIPSGFAINTIFHAAILWGGWVVFLVPGKLKRTLRRRRGQCPACGYPIGTSPVCTECGKSLV